MAVPKQRNYQQILQVYKQPIAEMVEIVLEEVRVALPSLSHHAEWAFDTLQDYSLRDSKRVRGCLAAAIYDDACGETLSTAGLRLGAAIELVQNHLLIVDDVMDRSVLRRGQPTVHEMYASSYHITDQHEAGMIGILVGLMAQHAATLAITTIGVPAERVVETLSIVQRHTLITDIGQIDDMQQVFGRSFSTDDLLRKYQQKSSYYSFVDPLLAGLTLAGKGGEGAREDCEAFGLPAGVAFQLRDDYLGIFGQQQDTGKSHLDDIREGKHTIMVDYALRAASAQQRSDLRRSIGNENAGEKELQSVRHILKDTGAVDASLGDARRYADNAVAAIRSATSWSAAFGEGLIDLIHFAVEREK